MNWGELEKLLKRNGWRFDHSGGKHDVYCHPTIKYPIQIGRHKTQEVATGTLKQILKVAGIK